LRGINKQTAPNQGKLRARLPLDATDLLGLLILSMRLLIRMLPLCLPDNLVVSGGCSIKPRTLVGKTKGGPHAAKNSKNSLCH
jgi:hypothetical protein